MVKYTIIAVLSVGLAFVALTLMSDNVNSQDIINAYTTSSGNLTRAKYESIKDDSSSEISDTYIPVKDTSEDTISNYIDPADFKGTVIDDNGRLTYCYHQQDDYWKSQSYGPVAKVTYEGYGCGPTSLATALYSIGFTTITPFDTGDWLAAEGYCHDYNGTVHIGMYEGALHFGAKAEILQKNDADGLVKHLKEGHYIIAILTGPGAIFNGRGHFVVARGLDSSGNILLADPASRANNGRSFTVQEFISNVKSSYNCPMTALWKE